MMKHIVLFALSCLAGSAASADSDLESRAAIPLTNPGSWVTFNDYPGEALRARATGVVRFELSIGTDGRVKSCSILRGSGSAILDEATCALLGRRAAFRPARDLRGKAVAGTWASSVRWQIPSPPLPSTPMPAGTIAMTYLVNPDGSVTDCKIEIIDGGPDIGGSQFDGNCPPMRFGKGYTDAAGKPVSQRVRMTTEISLEDAKPVSPQP